jgi:RsiW-degrading membrane proteinase PrsW (M82 family)
MFGSTFWIRGAIAVVFAVVWVWAFYREDKRPEPLKVVAWAAFWGMVAFFAAFYTEAFFLKCPFLRGDSIAGRTTLMLLIVGPVEELSKFAAVRYFIYPRRVFNEPMDGIIYGVAAATAFALVESFVIAGGDPKVILVRSPGAPLLHILFAGFWGSALGWAKWMDDRRAARRLVLLGLLFAALTHGAFNFFSYAAGNELSPWTARVIILALIVFCLAVLRWQMKRATVATPFSKRKQKGG